jgi:MFS family permease
VKTDERLLTPAFALASASHLLHGLSFFLHLHLPGFLHDKGASETEIGLLFGVTALTAIVARPFIGRTMDVRGRRVVIRAGGMLTVVVCAMYLFVDRIGPLAYLARIGHGVGEAMLFSALFAYASDIVPASKRIQGIGLFGVSGLLPISLGGVLGDVILSFAGYRELFATSLGCSVVALLLSLPLRDVARPPHEDAPRGLWAAVTARELLPLWFCGTVFATTSTFLKTYVLEQGVGSVGLYFTAYSGAAIALRVLLGSLPERLGPKRVLYPSMAATAIGFMVLAHAGSDAEVALAGVLSGLGHGYTFPILLGLVVNRSKSSERGAALSVFTALFDLGILVGSPVLGAVIEASGYGAMFTVAAAIAVVGGIVFALWDHAAVDGGGR